MRRPGGPGGPGFGQGVPGRPGGPGPGMIPEHLALTDEQKAQWKAIHERARETGEPLMKATGEAKEAFDTALNAENAEATAVGQAALAMRSAHQKVEAHHKATLAEVKAILTPEQLAKMEEMEKHARRPGPGGFGQGGFGPGGPEGQGPRRRQGPKGSN